MNTRQKESARTVLGALAGQMTLVAPTGDERGENQIMNSDFSEPIAKPWSMVSGVVRRETEALSGDWMLSALDKNHFIINYMDDPDLRWAFKDFSGRVFGKGVSPVREIDQSEQSNDLNNRTIEHWPAYVVHVDIVLPSGKCPFRFQRDLAAKDCAAKLAFPLALNDEVGVWNDRVTEPLTGISSQRTISVRPGCEANGSNR